MNIPWRIVSWTRDGPIADNDLYQDWEEKECDETWEVVDDGYD